MERPRRIVDNMRISVSCLEIRLPEEDSLEKRVSRRFVEYSASVL